MSTGYERIETPIDQRPFAADLIATAVDNLRLLLMLGVVGAIAAVGIAATMDKKYRASARILVDPRDLVILGEQVTPNTEAEGTGAAVVESQALVFTSRVVLNDVIDRLRLDENPDFNGVDRGGWLSSFASTVGSDAEGEEVDLELQKRRQSALVALQKSISVERIAPSYVLEISATASSADFAERIVDAVVLSYLQDLLRSRAEIARRASDDITAGIEGLRERVHSLEEETANYIARHNLFESQGEMVVKERLTMLTRALQKARIDATKLKAQLDNARDDLGALTSLPEALASPAINTLRAAQAELAVERARQPTIRALDEQQVAIEGLIENELERIRSGLAIEYARAVQHVVDLEAGLDTLRGEIVGADLAEIQLRELTRELEAYQSIYNEALTRARQAREQARVNTANVRVISNANAETNRVSPPSLTLVAGFGFVVFMLGGYFVFHVRTLAHEGRL